MIELPRGIDYSKYNSKSGMSTKHWGPAAWKFLFTSIMGNYPTYINKYDDEHIIIKESYKNMLTGLVFVMPCVYCRDSFKIFLTELPIDDYLSGRIELMYWLYLMKNKVNNKLKKQEEICYLNEKKRLKSLYYSKQLSETDYYIQICKFKTDTFLTVDSPTFQEVLETYEKLRAICSPVAKTCTLPKK